MSITTAAIVICGLLVAVAVGRLALVAVVVVGGSMEPTLNSGDLVLATRFWPRRWLRRGEIVLVRGYGGAEPGPSGLMIKRVGWLGGDTVPPRSVEDAHQEGVIVGRDQVFVMSDVDAQFDTQTAMQVPRLEAIDSRVFGPIPMSSIAGKALMRFHLGPTRR